MQKLHIPVVVGTTRPGRQSLPVAQFIFEILSKMENVTTELVDPKDFNMPFDGNDEENKDPKYTAITAEADGFFIVVPEYNHSFPGTLKRLLDSELKNYIHKPVAFAGVSAGPWGGIRAIQSLVQAVREMGLIATHTDVQFASVGKLVGEDGNISDEKYVTRVTKALNELLWMAETLKWGRDNVVKEK
jgi:NAD(P)H-dependent FMN reductase